MGRLPRSAPRPVRPVRNPGRPRLRSCARPRALGGEEAGVEAARPPRRRDGAGDEMDIGRDRDEPWPWRTRPRSRPASAGGCVALDAEQQAGFLGQSRGRRRARRRARIRRSALATRSLSFASHVGMQLADRRISRVERLDAAAGKHELARHEFVAVRGGGRAAPSASAPERSISIRVAASRGSLSGNDWSRSDLVMRSAQTLPRSSSSRVIVPSVACRAGGIACVRSRSRSCADAAARPSDAAFRDKARSAARRQPARLRPA